MSDIEQAYRTLGLESDASFKEVMEAHRDLAVVWDPRPHENNPRLHRKATENLARLNQAFQLIRHHHLGTHPEEELLEPVEQAGAESEEQESTLYDEIFTDREAEEKRRMPIGKIVVSVLVLMIVLVYWSGSREGDQNSTAAEQTSQGTEGLLEVEIKNGSMEVPSREPSAAEPIGESADASEPLIVKKSASSPVPKSPAPVETPRREAPVVEPDTPEPVNRPVLQRTTPESNPEVESPTAEELQEAVRSQEAFEMLRDKSAVAQKLIEGELQQDLNYQEWKMVRAREPEFWIDLIAQRSSDQGELHLIWSVNAETGVVIPMSQAARDLDAELSTQR